MTSRTMRRWVLPLNPEGNALQMQQVDIPEPGPGEVRVRVHAAAINYRDLLILDGHYGVPAAPDLIPLSDGAGVVDAVGHGVEEWSVGDRVISVYFDGWPDLAPGPGMGVGLGSGSENGMLTEYAVLPAGRVVRAPASLSLTEAATLPCAALTAWTALHGNRPYCTRTLGPGDVVLVLGSGGVSLFAAQLALKAGAEVWATTSAPSKQKMLRDLGVTGVVDYTRREDWGQYIFEQTGGAHLVVNAAGGASMNQAIAAVAYGGEIAFMGLFDFATGTTDLLSVMGKGSSIRGVAVGSAAALEDLVNTIDSDRIEPVIQQIVDFDHAPQAYTLHKEGASLGKVVIEIVPATESGSTGDRRP